ncbi:unnamed protein product [Mytilus edulis]|uniref:Uncharacterized protein n=1 Tax=Mytilus edulis TaxID=6550 RepID=A0A8S3THR7_MYTED|nr:unnamed protein product [Mytilus edulis]
MDINVEYLISNNDITLTSVYCDYPDTCLPTKFNAPSGPKGKRALTEEIDTHLYDEAAHMIAFRIPHSKLAPWIKSLSLLYYEHYGKSSDYVVSWFDDPENWSTKNSGNKSICVEISTKADVDSLLYKITLFVNTGLVQVQGNHKDTFVDKDFPVLVKLVNIIYMATNTDESGPCKINTTQSGSATDLSEQTNIKQISTLIDRNNNKDLASHKDRTVSKDKSDLQSDISDLQTKLNNKISKIEEMASAYNSVSENLKHKEDEVLSLKLHLSQDNTNDFQEVKLKHPKTRNTKHVVLIGTSNIKGIDPNKLSSKYSAEKHEAFTLEQTDHVIQELEVTPDILVLHSLSNAVRSTPNEKSIEYLHTIIDSAKEKFNDTKIVISLPTPRADEESLNNKAQILSLMAKEDLRNEPNVEICDNSNMAFKGSALQKYLDPKDNYHLSLNGTKMLASNIRDTIDRILGLPPRTPMKRNVNQYNYTPPRVQRDNTNDFVPDDDSHQYMYNRGRGQRYRGGRGNNHQFRGNRGYHRRGY